MLAFKDEEQAQNVGDGNNIVCASPTQTQQWHLLLLIDSL